MTLQELKCSVDFEKVSYGTWIVYRFFSRDRYCTGITHNSLAIDRINSDVAPRTSLYGYTLKQAYYDLLSCVVTDRIFVIPKNR